MDFSCNTGRQRNMAMGGRREAESGEFRHQATAGSGEEAKAGSRDKEEHRGTKLLRKTRINLPSLLLLSLLSCFLLSALELQ